MKRILFCFCALYCVSCNLLGPVENEEGDIGSYLRIAFAPSFAEMTRSMYDLPDTSDFILTVTDADGQVYYHGNYGDSPESIMVKPGSYVVKVISENFTRPAFSKPQYGDEQCVVVPKGGVADVRLSCRQVNSGVRLIIDAGFLTLCPDGVLFLRSSHGSLMYSYGEKRIAYFHAGDVSLILSSSGKDEVLMTRSLEPQEVLVLKVSVSSGGLSGKDVENISIAIDTTRKWTSEAYVIGGDDGKGSDMDNALTVSQAMSSVGDEDVWVSGYIVGGDLTSSSASFEEPFSSRTCILLGSRSSVDTRSSCISVQLPSGDVRDDLNLVDNPELLGRKILLKGDIVASYYGLVGLKNCSDYKL